MGVGEEKNHKDIFFGPYVRDNEMHVLESPSSASGLSTDEEDNQPPTSPSRSPRHRNRNAARPRSQSVEACLTGMYRRCGAKQARRTENIKFLLNMTVIEDDIEPRTPTYTSDTSSGFSALFQEKAKMKAWNDFVNSSEEDQKRILAMRQAAANLGSIQEASDEEDQNGNPDSDDSWEKVSFPGADGIAGADRLPGADKRAVHPSFSAEECFERLDKNLRSILTRRHMPLGILGQLEREVVEFFKDHPGSVYVSYVVSSFERLLLHAVCQYLGLHCHSHEENGLRRTQVENRYSTFQLPPQSLVDYLERIS